MPSLASKDSGCQLSVASCHSHPFTEGSLSNLPAYETRIETRAKDGKWKIENRGWLLAVD